MIFRSKILQIPNEAISVETIDCYIKKYNDFHVLISLCNALFRNILFTGKLMALACSILGTYYVLSSENASYIFLLFFGAFSLNAILFYTIACQHLFSVPTVFERFKEHCSMMLNKRENVMTPWEEQVRKYRIQAMHKIGIKDGGFRVLQSVSTLLFIDFYLNTVISLLLM